LKYSIKDSITQETANTSSRASHAMKKTCIEEDDDELFDEDVLT
jgi:hypothetical protein